jgi:hypothetical protein
LVSVSGPPSSYKDADTKTRGEAQEASVSRLEEIRDKEGGEREEGTNPKASRPVEGRGILVRRPEEGMTTERASVALGDGAVR